MLIQEFLERSCNASPDKTALIAGERRLAYHEIDSSANSLAHALREAGVAYGDRVAVFLDNSPEAVISIFGILKADAAFVVLNPTIKADKLAYILNNCRTTALITHASRWEVAGAAAKKAPSLKAVVIAGDRGEWIAGPCTVLRWEEIQKRYPTERPARQTIDIDIASLVYTSGTTGNPKGVVLTHQNMVSASTSITTYLENTANDIILSVLPLSFDYGLYQILMAAQFGGTVVLEKSFLYPYAVINLLKKEKVTGFPIVPTISAILLQLEELGKERFEHLRYLSNTAAALPVSHIRGLQRVFPGARIYSMYGLTECKRVSYLPPEELERRPTSVGKGMPNEQVYLVDEENRVITKPGVAGELVIRGANVMKGYWELPEETARMLRPGRFPWEQVLYSGDLFTMDEEGFLYFVSRKDDIIKSRGEKVSPIEVERVLYEIPGIVEAAVVGMPDETLGEAVKAFVVLEKGSALTAKEIVAHCMKRLEDFMVPKIVEFRDSLPKTSSGKITKKGL
jgi:amino acid adenylation domain-containing protein